MLKVPLLLYFPKLLQRDHEAPYPHVSPRGITITTGIHNRVPLQ